MQPDGVMVTYTWCVPNYKLRGWSTDTGRLTSLFLLHVFLGVQYSLQSVQFFLLLIYFLPVGAHTHTHTPYTMPNNKSFSNAYLCHSTAWMTYSFTYIHSLQWFLSLSLISQSFFPVNDHIQTQWPLNNQEEKRKVWTVLGSSRSTGPKIWKENQFHSHDSLLATNKNKQNWPRFSCTLLLLITFI